ncbi:MAG: hypothetical protein ACR2OR_16155 [Hyphomicrobiales bacterium]
MQQALNWLAAKGTIILPVSLLLGLFWQDLAALARPMLTPTVFFMLAVLMTRVDMDDALAHLRRPFIPIIGLIWAVVIMPLVFAAALWLLGNGAGIWFSGGLVLALFFWASSPPIFSSAPLSYIMRLDGTLSVGFLLAAIALHPIVTPFYTGLFTGGTVSISPFELGWRLALLIGGAALCALGARAWLGREKLRKFGPAMDGLNVVGMVIFALAIMDGIADRLLENPLYAAWLTVFVFCLSLVVHAVTTALFWRSGKRRALTIGFSTGGRNIAMAVGALGASVPSDTWLFFAIIQFPIYILPAMLLPIYNRLLPNR